MKAWAGEKLKDRLLVSIKLLVINWQVTRKEVLFTIDRCLIPQLLRVSSIVHPDFKILFLAVTRSLIQRDLHISSDQLQQPIPRVILSTGSHLNRSCTPLLFPRFSFIYLFSRTAWPCRQVQPLNRCGGNILFHFSLICRSETCHTAFPSSQNTTARIEIKHT